MYAVRVLQARIESLDPTAFVELCSSLLVAVAVDGRVPRECFALNLKISEPDGGLDARCVEAPAAIGRLVPAGSTGYQFKGGRNARSANELVKDDILAHQRVVRMIEAGHTFVYIAAWDRGDEFEEDVVSALRDANVQTVDGQIRFISGFSIASHLSRIPSLVRQYLRLGAPLSDIETWARIPRLQNKFQRDEMVAGRLKELTARIEEPGSITRLVGPPGHGKTRLALEALKDSESLASHVLYADQRSEVSAEFIGQLRTGDMLCTLVVDEVDDVEHERLSDRFAGMPGGVRLLTIGVDTSGSGTAGTLEVNPLDNELIQGILRDVARGIPDETARTLADYCEGSPKLAFILASRISENPDLPNAHQYLKDRPFRDKLTEYLGIDDDVAWRGVRAASILHHVGWTGDVEAESTTLFTALKLNAVDTRRAVKDLDERLGVAPLAGRYRYVSPKILADYLAAREVEAWTKDDFHRVLAHFTPAMAQSFMRRMRHVGGVVENRQIMQDLIFGENGPFRSLADVEGTGMAFLFRHLSGVFPMAALRALERTIGEAEGKELRAATGSRRDVVWALEELLWPAETFEGAAWLVLQLAAAENEHWGNNATGLWSATFQMVLGRTEAGRAARVRTLRRAANHELPAFRVLTCKAVESALNVEHESRLGNPPADVAGMPKDSWRPETYGEWAETACDYLGIVSPLLDDPDGDVRIAAAECVGSGVNATLVLPSSLLDVWLDVALSLRDREYALRSPVLEAIDFHLARDEFIDENPEDEEERKRRSESATIRTERLERLRVVREEIEGQDFQTRFRRTVSRDIWQTSNYEEATRERRRELETLADEVIQEPALLNDEWPWLLSRQTTTPEEWAEVLGTRDAGRVHADTLANLAQEDSRAMGWLSLYELGFAAKHGNDSHIDDRIASLRVEGASSEQIFDLVIRSNFTAMMNLPSSLSFA